MLRSLSAPILLLALTGSASAYSGRTTDAVYRSGTVAAQRTAAFYATRGIKSGRPAAKVFRGSDMQIIKRGKTPAGHVSSSWRLVTKRLAPDGRTGLIDVKVKKLGPTAWKGYTDGLNTLRYLPK